MKRFERVTKGIEKGPQEMLWFLNSPFILNIDHL